MITLFIDTSYKNMIVAVIKDDSILSLKEGLLDTMLSSLLVPSLEGAIKEANIKPNDVDNIMVVNGPGSFTGVRMGVTVAKTYAWALNKKIIPISSLEVMASSATTPYIVPVIDARHNKVFAAIYDNNLNVIYKDSYTSLDIVLDVLKGNNATLISDDLISANLKIEKTNIDIIKVVKKHLLDDGVNPHLLNPNYLKNTEAEENLNKEKK